MTQTASVTWHQTGNRDVNKVAVGLGLTSFPKASQYYRGVKEGLDAGPVRFRTGFVQGRG